MAERSPFKASAAPLARYNEKLKHSTLAHRVPDETMEHFYRTHDWEKITQGKESGILTLHGERVPFVTMGNEPELTDTAPLAARYGSALQQLMALCNG